MHANVCGISAGQADDIAARTPRSRASEQAVARAFSSA